MWHKPCRTFHPWCPCIKTRCLSVMFVWSSLLSHFWLSTMYDKIYIQYIGKSHMHSMILRNGCRHGNDSIAAGRTRGCHHGRPWCNQQRQSRRHDDPRSSVDKIQYNISIKPLKHECICHNIKFILSIILGFCQNLDVRTYKWVYTLQKCHNNKMP